MRGTSYRMKCLLQTLKCEPPPHALGGFTTPSPPSSNTLGEEKRRIEGRLATMEEDLEEEQMNSESATERARKAQEQADQMTSEISQLQSNVSKLEKAKGQLEKQARRAGRVGSI